MASSNVVVQRHSNSAPTIFSSSGDGGGWDNYSEAAKVIALETFNKLIKEHRDAQMAARRRLELDNEQLGGVGEHVVNAAGELPKPQQPLEEKEQQADTADVLPKEDEKEKEKVDNAEEEEVVGIYNERIKATFDALKETLALDEQLNLLDGNMSAGLAVNQQTHLRDIRQRLWTSLDDGRSPWAHVERERLAALCAVRAAMASLAHFCCRAAAAENEGGGGVITGLEQLQLGTSVFAGLRCTWALESALAKIGVGPDRGRGAAGQPPLNSVPMIP